MAAGAAVVHVAGAVRRPGVYRMPAGARVEAAVRRAGGPTRRADLGAVNLAAEVEDGRQILVPRRARRAAGSRRASAPEPAPPGQPLNLNTATLEQLDTLSGVGPATAQKILDAREERGGFGVDRGAGGDPGDRRGAAGDAARGGDGVSARPHRGGRAGSRWRARAGTRGTSCCSRSSRACSPPRSGARLPLVAARGRGARRPGGWPLAAGGGRRGPRRARRWPTPRLAALGPGALPRSRGGRSTARRSCSSRRAAASAARPWPASGCVAVRGRRRDRRSRRFARRARRRRATRRAAPAVGGEVALRGMVGRCRRSRRTSAGAAPTRRSTPARGTPTGARRGGLAGCARPCARPRGGGARRAGCRRRRRRCCADGARAGRGDRRRTCATTSERRGLAHLLAVSGQNVLLLCVLVLALAAAAGVPLRARLLRRRGARRALRAAGRRGPVDPARGRDGRRGAGGRARGPARVALVRARPRRGRHARAQPARRREPGWQLSFAAVVGLMALVPADARAARAPDARRRSRRRWR